MALPRPIKAYRTAFAEAYLRNAVEKNGFDPNFSVMRTMRNLGVELKKRGLSPNMKQEKAIVKASLNVARTIRAVEVLKKADAKGIDIFDLSHSEVKPVPDSRPSSRPYGRYLRMSKESYESTLGGGSSGSAHVISPDFLEEVLHPTVKKMLRDHGVAVKDLSGVFAYGLHDEDIESHEFEHLWSQAAHGVDRKLYGEELAARFVHIPFAYEMVNRLTTPPERSRETYFRSLGLNPEAFEALMKLQEESVWTITSKKYAEYASALASHPQFLKQSGESYAKWRLRSKKFLSTILSDKHAAIVKTIYLRREHRIGTNLITALLRVMPAEHVPTVLDAAIKLGKMRSTRSKQ